MKKNIFSDEAQFHGYINKQHFRFWCSENQYIVLQKPMPGATCEAEASLAHISLKVGTMQAITPNSDTYHIMITDFFIPPLHGVDVNGA